VTKKNTERCEERIKKDTHVNLFEAELTAEFKG
jgi:hypothetical protein